MVILICGEKGGTGKTTLAVNLAAYRQGAGRSVLIIDTDPQRSASDWCYFRKQAGLPPIDCAQLRAGAMMAAVPGYATRYQDVIIDAGGRDNPEMRAGLVLADLVLLPVRASQYDLASVDKMRALLDQVRPANARIRCLVVINSVKNNPRIPEFSEALQTIQQYDDIEVHTAPIYDRMSYARSGAEGRGVHEMADTKAAAEISTLNEKINNVKI